MASDPSRLRLTGWRGLWGAALSLKSHLSLGYVWVAETGFLAQVPHAMSHFPPSLCLSNPYSPVRRVWAGLALVLVEKRLNVVFRGARFWWRPAGWLSSLGHTNAVLERYHSPSLRKPAPQGAVVGRAISHLKWCWTESLKFCFSACKSWMKTTEIELSKHNKK